MGVHMEPPVLFPNKWFGGGVWYFLGVSFHDRILMMLGNVKYDDEA